MSAPARDSVAERINIPMTPLSTTHLHLHATAATDLFLDHELAGNNLRNAWANVIRHTTCPETHRREAPTAEHVAACPACWFLSAEDQPGSVVRPYAFVPPLPPRERVPAGEPFSFGLTLFGRASQFLPYVVLAAAEMGRVGVGRDRRDGLGRFTLQAIDAVNPLTGETARLLAPGDPLVRLPPPSVAVAPAHAAPAAARLAEQLRRDNGVLAVRFLSPLRLEEGDRLIKTPDFGVFFKRLLLRYDDLGRRFAGAERRDRAEVAALQRAADRVRLVESRARWRELWSYSGRKGRDTPLGGLVGWAVYRADPDVWPPLLPWLVLGQGVQAGKSAVKGNGVYELSDAAGGYWARLRQAPETADTDRL